MSALFSLYADSGAWALPGTPYEEAFLLCGSLVEVGKGKWSVEHFLQVLESRDNSLSGPALPPHGLFLNRVIY